jgi:hypothetical protein
VAAVSTGDSGLDDLITRVKASGGSEIANTQPFIVHLCQALGLAPPEFSTSANHSNDYVFERRIDFKHPDGSTTPGRIDLYKRGCFVLESKQSSSAHRNRTAAGQPDLLGEEARQVKLGTARRGTRGWDRAMLEARGQAESYARALPVEHGYPPFLIVLDVGNVIELYADFSGQGKNYAHFPDRQSYRITMDDLRLAEVQARLRAIWTDPASLDPAKRSAEVTRDIAERLARIARNLEGRHDPRDVAEFLMRCLFTMFAEDVGLLPEDGFANLLKDLRGRADAFPIALETLWRTMDEGGYEPRMMQSLRRFNGTLFKTRRALPLERADIEELYAAATKKWGDVEPAIFGTLLERALDPRERSKLGAHYTPRAYVERLVVPTIIEPLRSEWTAVQTHIVDLKQEGKNAEALQSAKDFHHRLCTIRVLDPACGTGNFLYVALELMKKLEGEVLEEIEQLGEQQARFVMEGETVNPRQFYGLELNPRAVPIADLVLWIGYLKWQLRTMGLAAISEPVLHAYGTIRHQDAILAYDRKELRRDASGKPETRWDGVTMKIHPVTGEEVPDPAAQVELYTYVNPRPAPWPEVEFIVGNPPFIGGKDMRAELGDGYAEACWKARPKIPGGADFVMHFWDEAAVRLLRPGTKTDPNPLIRFGFITTNSITQTFSRRVVEAHLAAKEPLSLVYAIPDHPWLKAADKAAVRIAMTVAVRGASEGVLAEVVSESGLNTDTPRVELRLREGKLRANLTIGADLASTTGMLANSQISSPGIKLHGAGFIITPQQAASLGFGAVTGLEDFIRDYRNGRDIADRPRGVMVIDLYTLTADQVLSRFPQVFQHLLENVKPERDANPRSYRRENWWLFGENIPEARKALFSVPRYITTIETAKHRFFQFLGAEIRPDNVLVNIGLDSPRFLSVLSSRVHSVWMLAVGGTLEDRPRYNKTRVFDPFPFPAFSDLPPALLARLDGLGERLDSFRKARLAEHEFLTMTGLYNVLERLRELEDGADVPPLDDKERAIHEAGLVSVLKEIHDDIDRAVFEAYGWSDLAGALVGKPGATTPSPHKKPEQEAAEEELLSRLVALNRERAAEEARGLVRWLRPDYQIPRLGAKVAKPAEEQIEAELAVPAVKDAPKWPADALDQIRIVRDVLAKAPAPALPDAVAASFGGRVTPKRRARVEQVLETLVATGAARTGRSDGATLYFVPR